ncbi:metal ABC transporter ATP-binding protein [Desulfurococcus amylolyticus]|uniref:metal ABC transporter ATP-binding protein n=1 Tax=Desulfurococcus amylolyticus TaxID=94694 RepID=UPI0005B23548|nr:ATP-binding cassette domain-containing protein [Desulfurococcus amylolyticus]
MIIELIDLTVKRGHTLVLNNLNAVFEGPGLIQVIGPNGAGKTTLLLTILGLIKPVKGAVRIRNTELKNSSGGLYETISYIPQKFYIPRDAPITLWEFVESYIRAYEGGMPFRSSHTVNRRIESALEMAGLPKDSWDKKISELSGGQLQRALMARVLSVDSEIVLMDEPLSNIDPEGRGALAEIIGKLSSRKLLVVTNHDPVLLLPYTSKILLLGYGEYRYGDPDSILSREVLTKIYKSCAIVFGEHAHIADWH